MGTYTRRDSLAVTLRAQKASLDPTMHVEAWDPSAKVTFDRTLTVKHTRDPESGVQHLELLKGAEAIRAAKDGTVA